MVHSVTYSRIEGLRFFLAALVVGQHLATFSQLHGRATPVTTMVGQGGDAAVMSFIMLSGFLTKIRYISLEGTLEFRTFLRRRIARIWPEYLPSLVCAGFLMSAWIAEHGQSSNPTPLTTWSAISQVTLLHAWPWIGIGPGWNGVTWSLSIEWLLYLTTPILLSLTRPLLQFDRHVIPAISFATIPLLEVQFHILPASLSLVGRCAASYLAGILCGCHFISSHQRRDSTRKLQLSGCAIVIAAMVLQFHLRASAVYLMSLGTLCLLLGLTESSIRFTGLQRQLWGVSYGIFLWHSLILGMIDLIFRDLRITSLNHDLALSLAVFLASTTVALLSKIFADEATKKVQVLTSRLRLTNGAGTP
mgnify:CR=1 FL=1